MTSREPEGQAPAGSQPSREGGAEPCSLEQLVDELQDLRPTLTRLLVSRADQRLHRSDGLPGLTRAQHLALSQLSGGPLTITELGRRTGVEVSTATRMAQRLESLGLVRRSQQGAADRRARYIAITDLGAEAVLIESGAQRDRLCALLGHLSPRERHQLKRGLDILTAALEHDDRWSFGPPSHLRRSTGPHPPTRRRPRRESRDPGDGREPTAASVPRGARNL